GVQTCALPICNGRGTLLCVSRRAGQCEDERDRGRDHPRSAGPESVLGPEERPLLHSESYPARGVTCPFRGPGLPDPEELPDVERASDRADVIAVREGFARLAEQAIRPTVCDGERVRRGRSCRSGAGRGPEECALALADQSSGDGAGRRLPEPVRRAQDCIRRGDVVAFIQPGPRVVESGAPLRDRGGDALEAQLSEGGVGQPDPARERVPYGEERVRPERGGERG